MSVKISDSIILMAADYLGKDENHFRIMMTRFVSPIKIVCDAYRLSVKDGLKPIEELPEETKRKLFTKAKEWKPDGNTEQLINLCKALWLKQNI